MKNLSIRIFAVSTMLLLMAGVTYSQGTGDQVKDKVRLQDQTHQQIQDQIKDQDQLKTQDQAQLKDQQLLKVQEQSNAKEQLNRQSREKFRNSLTEEQIAILENKEMTQSQKREAFMNSLSEQQRLMLRETQMIRQQQKSEIQCGNVTQEQAKQMIQYRNGGNDTETGKNRNGHN